jgi:hypothetical protein
MNKKIEKSGKELVLELSLPGYNGKNRMAVNKKAAIKILQEDGHNMDSYDMIEGTHLDNKFGPLTGTYRFTKKTTNVKPLENKKVTKKRVGKKLDKSSQDDVE